MAIFSFLNHSLPRTYPLLLLLLFQSLDTMHFLHKYFPQLNSPGEEYAPAAAERAQEFRGQQFSVPRLAKEILQFNQCRRRDDHVKQFQSEDRHRCFNARLGNPGRLRFAHVARLGAFEERKEEEEGEKSTGQDPGLKEGRAKGRNSWKDMPKFLLAGAVSTVISRTFVAPLERIKLECIVRGSNQSWVRIIQMVWVSEGLRGFWKGNALNLFRMVPFKSINFICYDMYLDSLLGVPEKKEITNKDRLVGGGLSGVVATVICLPLDTIRTRLIAPGGEALGGVTGCFFGMIQKEGFLSLYKGLTPTLLSMGPANAVFYAIYGILKSSHLSYKKKKFEDGNDDLGVLSTLVFGAIAGACAETVTYPLEVVRRQLQLQQASLGMMPAFIKLIEREGVGSLFSGLIPSTLQVLPSAALSYFFYEMMKSALKIG
ncbi:putative mitochondrial adenine nucleotide transporter BTL3 [Iris pallida]|uniref:Mitochondrial adenine nucleotide transporter BTL3 n=1 Tax=Iris pallida TaxID=29817 RepID=A0AAX6HNH5_IRIPA|nr:putative mitochondrial adenine nucleotide transporter BTL3 [Iris pallida]